MGPAPRPSPHAARCPCNIRRGGFDGSDSPRKVAAPPLPVRPTAHRPQRPLRAARPDADALRHVGAVSPRRSSARSPEIRQIAGRRVPADRAWAAESTPRAGLAALCPPLPRWAGWPDRRTPSSEGGEKLLESPENGLTLRGIMVILGGRQHRRRWREGNIHTLWRAVVRSARAVGLPWPNAKWPLTLRGRTDI